MKLVNSDTPIGGYYELELRNGNEFHADFLALNTARNCLEYILKVQMPKKVFLPKYTCDVMLEPLAKLGIVYEFYSINNQLEIIDSPVLGEDEMIVYTNYFGVKSDYSNKMSEKYKRQLIMDCSQSFYYLPPSHVHAIYSPRKFFGVADGGYVSTDRRLEGQLAQDVSHTRMSHLLKRIDISPEDGFKDFKEVDEGLVGQPIKSMSKLTHSLLKNVDYELARSTRNKNFAFLHKVLSRSNKITLNVNDVDAPMVYPYLVDDGVDVRKKLTKNRIYLALYWPNVLEWCGEDELEYSLSRNLLPIPIDQRYGIQEMARILRCLQ